MVVFFPALGSYIPEVLMTSCTWEYVTYTWSNRSYTMMLCCFVFFIPMGIILFCYILMFLAVKKTGRLVAFYTSLNFRNVRCSLAFSPLPFFLLPHPQEGGTSGYAASSSRNPSIVRGNWQRLPSLPLWFMFSPGRRTLALH